MPKNDLEESFPKLATGGYRITSLETSVYTCAAWAARETHRWWDPSSGGGSYWPPGVPPTDSLAGLLAAFATLGYEPCGDSGQEPGVERLAIYADGHGSPTHVARQLQSGAWTSKLSTAEDIEHDTLEALEGPLYGKVVQHLRRLIGSGE